MELLESDSDDSEPESSLEELAPGGDAEIGGIGSGITLTAGDGLKKKSLSN